MTATPLHSDNVQTYAYFGEPVARYSLRNGINDGFLAPYRVRRVLLGLASEQEHSVAAARSSCRRARSRRPPRARTERLKARAS